jgi:hypothetical protein
MHKEPSNPCCWVTMVAAVVCSACGADDRGLRVTRRDSAGVEIVQNAPLDSGALAWWTLAPEPQLDIGGVEGSESQVLFGVNDAVRLSDGGIVIANAGNSQVRYYAANGAHRVTAGRQGSGPGEFQRITGLVSMPADSVAVLDGGARRVTVLGPDGMSSRVVISAPGARGNIVGRRADGTWVAQSTSAPQLDGVTQGPVRPNVTYVTLGPDGGEVKDTLGHFPGTERVVRVSERNGSITAVNLMTPPFGKATTFALAGNDLMVGTQDAAEVRVYDASGTLHRIVRTGVRPQRLTPEMVEAYLERQLERVPPDQRPATGETQKAILMADVVPPYGAIAVDRSGNLWVQDYPGLSDDQRWSIFDADGARIARVVLPRRFTPYDIGEDWILGRELAELDVEHVRLYAIRRSASTK